jgi:hypothetical protein
VVTSVAKKHSSSSFNFSSSLKTDVADHNENGYLSGITGRAMAQAVSRRPLTAAARVRGRVNPVGFVVNKVALGQVFLRVLFSPANIIPSWASHFRSLKRIFLSLIHPFIHSFMNNRPVKAAAVQ